jgi:hypothetical protein
MDPDDSLVDSGHCLANPGLEYVVYQPEKREFTLKVKKAGGRLVADWFNPLTGERTGADNAKNGDCHFVPPAGWSNGPVVLHVGRAAKERTVFRSTFERALPSR